MGFVDNNEPREEIEENKRNINERQSIPHCALQKCLNSACLITRLGSGFLHLLRLGVGGFLPLPDGVEEDVDQNDEEGKDETEEKPNIHNLDVGGGGETVGHQDVGGERCKR